MERSRADRILADWGRIFRQMRRPGLAPLRTVTTSLPIVVAAALIVAACQPGVGQPGPTASASQDEPSPSTVQPSVSSSGTWGPLAVTAPQDGADTLRAEGTLRITHTCVYLEWPPGEFTLLYWPANRTTWSGESRAVTFENFDGSVVTVSDGDQVVLGGSGGDDAEGGISGQEFVKQMDWVSPPASSCTLDRWWSVGAMNR